MAFFLLASAFGITALPPIFSKTRRVLWLVETELGDKAGVEKLAWGKQKQNFPFSLEYTFKEEIQNPCQVQGKPVCFTSLPARSTKLREGWFSPASTRSPPAHFPQTEQATQAGGRTGCGLCWKRAPQNMSPAPGMQTRLPPRHLARNQRWLGPILRPHWFTKYTVTLLKGKTV